MTEDQREAASEWPRHFPKECPPARAPDARGDVFRFVKNNPPVPNDMVSWLELGLGSGRDCQRAGLSCAVTREHLEEVRKGAPRRRSDLIARAVLEPQHGKLDRTGAAGHWSLWLRSRALAAAHELFEVVT